MDYRFACQQLAHWQENLHRYGVCSFYGRDLHPAAMRREMDALQGAIREYLERQEGIDE